MDTIYADRDSMSYIAAATTQIKSYPRELLSTLAVDEDLLIMVLAKDMYHSVEPLMQKSQESHLIEIKQSLDVIYDAIRFFAHSEDHNGTFNDAIDELLMWERRLNPPITLKYGLETLASKEHQRLVKSRIRLLNKRVDRLINHPEFIPYFNVGITDTGFIQQCIDSGIDVALAMKL